MFEKIIKKAEAYLQTDVRYILSGGFWLTMGQVISSGSSFLLSIAFANLLSKEVYGEYKYIISLFGLLGALSLSGLGTSITGSSARGYDGVLRKSFFLCLRWGFLITGVSTLASLYYFLNQNFTLGYSLLVVGVISPFLYSSLLYKSFLNGKKEFRALTLYGIIYNIVPVLCIIGTILLTEKTVFIVTAYLLSNTIISLILYRHVIKKYAPNDKIDEKSISFGKHLSLVNTLDTIATYIDKVLLFHFDGGINLAIYSFAVAVPEQIRSLLKMIPTLAIPKLSEKTHEQIQKTIYKKIFKVMLITIPIAVLYYFLAPYIYKIVFPEYIDSIVYSQVFILIILVEGGLPGAVFKAQMAVKESYLLNILGNTARIALIIPLVWSYGIWGLIVARILGRYLTFAISLALLGKMKEN